MKNTLSLLSILNNLGDEYVLFKKWDAFPSFTPGSTIDLLVIDRFEASLTLQNYFLNLFNEEEVSLKVTERECNIFLDIIHNNAIWLRIDLFDHFNFFTHFSVQDTLNVKVFLNREIIQFDNQKIYVSSKEFDLLIRYFEYLEWVEQFPDKSNYLDFILANSTQDLQQQLIKNAHRYTRYIHSHWQEQDNQRAFLFSRKQAVKEILRLIGFITRIF